MLQHVEENDFSFDPLICKDQPEVISMQLFLLGELAILALKDGKVYLESIIQDKRPPASCHKMLEENPWHASQHFKTVIPTWIWSETCVIACNIFKEKW